MSGLGRAQGPELQGNRSHSLQPPLIVYRWQRRKGCGDGAMS